METLLAPEEDRMGWRGAIPDSEVVKTHETADDDLAADDDADAEDLRAVTVGSGAAGGDGGHMP